MPSSHLMMEFLHGPGWTSILHRSTVPSEPGTGGAIAFHILTELEANPSPLQFIPSEMATKFEEIPVLVLMLRSAPTPWLTLLLFLQKILLIKFHVYSSDILKSTQNLKKKIFLMVWKFTSKCTKHEDCANFCVLLKKSEL